MKPVPTWFVWKEVKGGVRYVRGQNPEWYLSSGPTERWAYTVWAPH